MHVGRLTDLLYGIRGHSQGVGKGYLVSDGIIEVVYVVSACIIYIILTNGKCPMCKKLLSRGCLDLSAGTEMKAVLNPPFGGRDILTSIHCLRKSHGWMKI